MLRNLPNILTISRIIAIPFIVGCFYYGNSPAMHVMASCLFLFVAITDFLDGYLARAWSLHSKLGKFLDPIADKLLVSSTILVLVDLNRADILPALAIICREILVSGLREFLATLRVGVPVSKLSKLKTVLQMVAIFILLLGSEGSGISYMNDLGGIVLWVAAVMTVFTGFLYLKPAMKHFSESNQKWK